MDLPGVSACGSSFLGAVEGDRTIEACAAVLLWTFAPRLASAMSSSPARVRLAPLESRRWRLLSRSLIGPQCLHHALKLGLNRGVVPLPAREIRRQPRFDLLRLPAGPFEEKTVEVEGDEGQHLGAPLFHQAALLLEGCVDFIIDPPARQGGLRAAQ